MTVLREHQPGWNKQLLGKVTLLETVIGDDSEGRAVKVQFSSFSGSVLVRSEYNAGNTSISFNWVVVEEEVREM